MVLLVIVGITVGAKYQLQDKITQAFKAKGITVTNVQCPSGVGTSKGTTTTLHRRCRRRRPIRSHIVFDSNRHFIVTAVH